MLARYLSILVLLLLTAFPAAAGASPPTDLSGGSLASGSASLSPGSDSLTAEPNYDPVDPGSGRLSASSGFDVTRDGFSFDNWGPGSDEHRRSLTPAAMQSLFGDDICARIVNGECVLSAPGAALESAANEMAAGGHCYGMAAPVCPAGADRGGDPRRPRAPDPSGPLTRRGRRRVQYATRTVRPLRLIRAEKSATVPQSSPSIWNAAGFSRMRAVTPTPWRKSTGRVS